MKFKSGTTSAAIDAAITSTGGDSVRDLPQIGTRVITVSANARDAALAAYAKHAAVERVEPAHVVAGAAGPNDPAYAQQWALPKISWDVAYGSTPVIGGANIAVLDTGVDAAHPDLAPRVRTGQSFVGGVATTDPNGHGTALAGIAAASVNNLVGMAGVAYNAPVVTPVQVLHSDGTGLDSDVVAGVLWAADNGAKVILMGFSSPDFSAALQDAVNYAWNKGAVLVAATGNGGSSGATYPAGMANVIGVAATDQNDAVANSNTASAAVGAPGVGIYATQPGGGYGNITGTSASAAETAGLAALLIGSGKTNAGTSTQIRGATDPIAGRSFGRINVAKALTRAATPTPTPAPTPTPTPGPTPTYKVGASGVTSDFRQCANQDPVLGSCHWINGALISSDSEYFEGMSVPQRTIFLDIPATTGNAHTLTFHVQFTKSGVHGYDWLVSYNQAVADAAADGIALTVNADACGPEIGPPATMAADCSSIRSGPNSFTVPVPPDPFISKDGPTQTRITAYETMRGARTIKIYGDAAITTGLLALSHDPSANGSDTGDSDIDYTLTWTSASTKILIEMAGHLAVSNDGTADSWGVGLGASFISGGPYHFSLDNLDGKSLGSQDNQIQAGAIIARGTVSGVKFNDLNANHVRDSGEPGLSGWQIRAYVDSNGDGTLSASEAAATPAATTTTDSNGAYSFTLAVGTYVICEVLQTGWTQSAPTGNTKCAANTALGPAGYAVNVTCCPGSNATGRDFGNFQNGSVSGQKFNDQNANGVKDTGEPGLAGWTIRAYVDTNGNGTLDSGETTVAASAVTDSNGNYALSLTPGTYVICEVLQSGWNESLPSNTKCTGNAVSGLAPGGYAVTVTATSSATGKDFGNFQMADVHIQKTGNGPIVAGQTATFTITVSNAGPGPAIGVAVSDTLPTGTWTITAGAGWTCPATATTNFSCTLTGTLAAGATTEPITVSRTTTTADCGTLTNTASVTASNESVADQADNSASATITVQCPDVSVQKSAVESTVTAGSPASFSITVHAGGSGASTGVTLTDPLPGPATRTWTISGTNAAECNGGVPTAAGGSTLTCNFGTMPAGTDKTITLTTTTTADDCANGISNTATVKADVDTNPSNNSSSASIVVQCSDVHITKTGNGPVSAGQTATFTITVSNSGPGSATDVVVTDTLPPGTWTVSGCTGTTTATGSFSCNVGTLAAGGSVVITVSRTTTANDCGTLTNTATVAASNESPAARGDDSASATITVNCPDVSVQKTAVQSTVTAGSSASFTITVHAGGSGASTGVVLTDQLPGPTTRTWTISGLNAAECNGGVPTAAGGTTLTCNFGTMAAGTDKTITLTTTTTADDCANGISNTATVKADVDTNPSNNSSSATITVQCADVHITKTGNGPIFPGQTAEFTITVSNTGSGAATGVVVTDSPLPPGTWTVNAPTSAGCPTSATGSLTCTFTAPLASGASVQIRFSRQATFDDCGSITNPNAHMSASDETPGTQTDNDTGPASITVQCADVHIQKTGNGPVFPGDTATFTITVSNSGPGPAANVVVTDTLPPGTWTVSGCPGTTTASGSFSCTFATLGVGTTVVITVSRTTTTDDCGTVTNDATVSASNEPPTARSDDSASATITVQCADVHITKTGNGPIFAGETATFTITVSNAGPGAATGITVADTLPSGTWTIVAGAGWTCPANATGTFTCTFAGTLAAGGTTPAITVSRPTTTADCGDLTNTATVSAANEPPADQTDNTASATITVQCADVHIQKTGNGPIFPGDTATFTITVSNSGPGPAANVVVTDSPLPPGTWTVNAPASTGCPTSATGSLTCTFTAPLASGASVQIRFSRAATFADCGTLTNANAHVSASNETPGTQTDNDTGPASITVQCADVHITKTGNGPIFPGQTATFTITVSNAGPGPAANVVVTDTLPPGTWTVSGCPGTTSASGSFSCNLGTIAPSTSVVITVSRTTTTDDCGTLSNSATVSASNEPPADQSDNTASASIAVQCADVQITKTGNGPIFPGDTATFTITVSNAGPGPANTVVVTDSPLPPGTWTVTAPLSAGCPPTATGSLTCTFSAPLAAGASVQIRFSRQATLGDCGTLTNPNAHVSATNESPGTQTNDDSGPASITVQCADVHIQKTGSGPVFPGQTATFTITVSNAGPGPATGITVADTLPAGTWAISAGAGWTCPASATGSFSCSFSGTLAAGATTPPITVSRTVTTADCAGLTNSATVSATNEPTADQSDNSASATITVQCADVHITKTGNGPIFAGQTATFTITVSNSGPGPAADVTVTDTLPPGTWTVTGCPGTTTATGSFSCSLGTLPAGGSVVITVSRTTTPADCGTLTNTARVSASNETPGTQTDDTATATITVSCGGFGFMTGGGEITATSNGGKASFGFNARGTAGGTDAKGHFNYLNHVSGLHINGDVVQVFLVDSVNHLMRFCVQQGSTFYTVQTQDNGEPGTRGPDRLSVSSGGASCNPVAPFTEANNEGLKTGNIQWHPPGS